MPQQKTKKSATSYLLALSHTFVDSMHTKKKKYSPKHTHIQNTYIYVHTEHTHIPIENTHMTHLLTKEGQEYRVVVRHDKQVDG